MKKFTASKTFVFEPEENNGNKKTKTTNILMTINKIKGLKTEVCPLENRKFIIE